MNLIPCFMVALLAVMPRPTVAQYVVVDSKGMPDLRKGAMISAEQTIAMPAQAWLRLIGRDIRPVMLSGPLSGQAGALVGAAGPTKIDTRLLEQLAVILSQPFRVRGGPSAPGDFAAIDLLMPGQQCAWGETVIIRRPHSVGMAIVELARPSGRQRTNFTWQATQAVLPWPVEVDLLQSGTYETEVTAMTGSGSLRTTTTQFTLTLLPGTRPDNTADALQALLKAQCSAQVLRLVQSLEQYDPSR